MNTISKNHKYKTAFWPSVQEFVGIVKYHANTKEYTISMINGNVTRVKEADLNSFCL